MSVMEKKILKMEERENQLLERLKNSQQLEAEQFSRLEEAIQGATDAYQRWQEEMSWIEKPSFEKWPLKNKYNTTAKTDFKQEEKTERKRRRARRK